MDASLSREMPRLAGHLGAAIGVGQAGYVERAGQAGCACRQARGRSASIRSKTTFGGITDIERNKRLEKNRANPLHLEQSADLHLFTPFIPVP